MRHLGMFRCKTFLQSLSLGLYEVSNCRIRLCLPYIVLPTVMYAIPVTLINNGIDEIPIVLEGTAHFINHN